MFLRRRIAPNVDGFRIIRLASVSAEPVRRASIGQFDVVQSRNVRSGIGQSVVSQNTRRVGELCRTTSGFAAPSVVDAGASAGAVNDHPVTG